MFVLGLLCAGLLFGIPLARAEGGNGTEQFQVPKRLVVVQFAIPLSVAVWSVVLLLMQLRLGDAAYAWNDTILGLAAGGAVALIAMPIRYRCALNGQDLIAFSILAGAALIVITFVGYMTAGFL